MILAILAFLLLVFIPYDSFRQNGWLNEIISNIAN